MRNASSTVIPFIALVGAFACGHSDEGVEASDSPCLQGFSLLNEVEAELRRAPLSCSSAADCTLLPLQAECLGSQVSSCGIPVHRDILPHYDQANVDARFCAFVKGSEYGCWAGPSCAQAVIACEAGQCITKQASATSTSP